MEHEYEGRKHELELALLNELPQESLLNTLENEIKYLHSVKSADSNRPTEP